MKDTHLWYRKAAILTTITALICTTGISTAHATEYREGGGFVYPQNQDLSKIADPGAATYIGRDMIIASPDADSKYSGQSYAVEAEGLTVVKGKIYGNASKTTGGAWKQKAFRFGGAGLGSGYVPNKQESYSLSVAAQDSALQQTEAVWFMGGDGSELSRSGAFVGKTEFDDYAYTAKINGTTFHLAEHVTEYWYAYQDKNTWDSTDVLNVNGYDYTDFDTHIIDLSDTLAQEQSTGTVETNTAPAGDFWRYKYHTRNTNYKFIFDEEGENAERLITFTGDNTSPTQVFTIDGSELDSTGSRGLSFAFEQIPDNASVIINVKGDTPVEFTNGWRVWWNGTQMSDAWDEGADKSHVTARNTAATSIMWNFENTPRVTIHGGVLNQGDSRRDTAQDPAAEFYGSVLIPHGSLESWVSTNGRVYVGQDLVMPSITAPTTQSGVTWFNQKELRPCYDGEEGCYPSASVLDMDAERHNFPWNGDMYYTASAIQWNKVNKDNEPLAGSSWSVYTTMEDAANRENALINVQDNDANDSNKTDGVIQVANLQSNHDYFIRENSAPVGYDVNRNIYVIAADSTSISTPNTQVNVAHQVEDTTMITDEGHIVNTQTTSVAWVKYDQTKILGDDASVLSGSSWSVRDAEGTVHEIVDVTESPASVVFTRDGQPFTESEIDMIQGESLQLTAQVLPEMQSQQVVWSSSNPAVTVDNGYILAVADHTEPVTIQACSVIDETLCATLTIRVFDSFDLYFGDTKVNDGGTYAFHDNETPQITLRRGDYEIQRTPTVTSSAPRFVSMQHNDNNQLSLTGSGIGVADITVSIGKYTSTVNTLSVPEGFTAVLIQQETMACSSWSPCSLYVTEPDGNTWDLIDPLTNEERSDIAKLKEWNAKIEELQPLLENNVPGDSGTTFNDYVLALVPNDGEAFDFVIGSLILEPYKFYINSDGEEAWGGSVPRAYVHGKWRADGYQNFKVPENTTAFTVKAYYDTPVGSPVLENTLNGGEINIDVNDHYHQDLILAPQNTRQLTATVETNPDFTDDSVHWVSSDTSVVTVDKAGLVTAVGEGVAYVYAVSSAGQEDYVRFDVMPDNITRYYLTEERTEKLLSDDVQWIDGSIANPLPQRAFKYTLEGSWPNYYYADDGSYSNVAFTALWNSVERVDMKSRVHQLSNGVYVLDMPADEYTGYSVRNYQLEQKQCSEESSAYNITALCNSLYPEGYYYRADWTQSYTAYRNPTSNDYSDGLLLSSSHLSNPLTDIDGVPDISGDHYDDELVLPVAHPVELVDVDPRAGFFRLASIADGEYELIETQAPEGYIQLEQPVVFSVKDNQVSWPEGVPVIDSVAWIANAPTPVVEEPETPRGDSTPQGVAQLPEEITQSLASSGTSISTVGTIMMLCIALSITVFMCTHRQRGRHSK